MNTRRFLFSSLAGYGHLHPLVPLARALRDAGHDVAFAMTASSAARVEQAGFPFLVVSSERDQDPEFLQFDAERASLPTNQESELWVYTRLFIGITPRLKTPSLVEVARRWHADMLIREGGEYAAVIAAEHLGLPHATVSFAAALKTMNVFEREAAVQLDPIRSMWGLSPDPELNALYRYLYLAYSPPGFSMQEVGGPAAGALPATTHLIRPQLFDAGDMEQLPDWVTDLPAQPTVYVTLGTEVNGEPEFYPSVMQMLIAGLRDLPLNLIVTLGRDKDPADFGPQPANVHIERYIPQSLLLRHCDLMVMHGGSNSLLAAMDVGMPLVVVPLIADQFYNAHVTQNIQLGQVVPHTRLTPARIRAAVQEVLDDPTYRQTAQRLQTEMHALPGMEYAVELVERLVETSNVNRT